MTVIALVLLLVAALLAVLDLIGVASRVSLTTLGLLCVVASLAIGHLG